MNYFSFLERVNSNMTIIPCGPSFSVSSVLEIIPEHSTCGRVTARYFRLNRLLWGRRLFFQVRSCISPLIFHRTVWVLSSAGIAYCGIVVSSCCSATKFGQNESCSTCVLLVSSLPVRRNKPPVFRGLPSYAPDPTIRRIHSRICHRITHR